MTAADSRSARNVAARRALLLAVLGGLLHVLWLQQALPEEVPIHFDREGRPDGWASRAVFLRTHAGILLCVAFLFAGIDRVLPRIPSAWVGLPHRAYWLAPQRREQTLAFLSSVTCWYGAATVLFLTGLAHLSYLAVRSHAGRLSPVVWILAGAYILAGVIATAWLLVRFRVPGGRNGSSLHDA